MQIETVEQWFAGFVRKVDVLETDVAALHFQRQGIGFVQNGVRFGECNHAVRHGTDVFKQPRRFPHDKLRQAVQPQRHGRCRGHCARTDMPAVPQPNAQRGGGERERRIDDETAGVQQRGQPHLRVHSHHKLFHRLLGVFGFARAVRKELHGGDVGIRIGDAARHQAACVCLCLRGFAQFRHQRFHHDGKRHNPQRERHEQPAVQRGQYQAGGQKIHQHIHHHVGNGHHHVAHGQRRLHNFGGHAAGKFVLIEAERLVQHQAVEIPAQAHGKYALQRLQADVGRGEMPEHGKYHHRRHAEYRPAFFGEQCLRRVFAQPIHQLAHELEQQGFHNADASGEHGQREYPRAHALQAAPNKAERAFGGCFRGFGRIGFDTGFEPMKN